MNYLKNICAFVIAAVFLLSACDDYVTQPRLATQTLDDYFSSPESATQFIDGTYEAVNTNTWWKTNFFRLMNTMSSDDAWAGNTQQPRPEIYSYSAYSNVEAGAARNNSFWQFNYQGITRSNIAIEKIPEVEFDDQVIQERLVAEAKFLRSFFYFELVKNYGGVPVTTTFTELLDPKIYNYERQSQDSVYALIENGFREAADVLPAKSEYPATELGRATRGQPGPIWPKRISFRKNLLKPNRYSRKSLIAANISLILILQIFGARIMMTDPARFLKYSMRLIRHLIQAEFTVSPRAAGPIADGVGVRQAAI